MINESLKKKIANMAGTLNTEGGYNVVTFVNISSAAKTKSANSLKKLVLKYHPKAAVLIRDTDVLFITNE